MKKHLSVLMLFMRSTLYKFLILMLLMAAAESVLFSIAFKGAQSPLGLDAILISSRLELVFAVCFVLLCAIMCLTGCDFGGHPGYTLERLRISYKGVLFWQAVNNLGLLILFCAAQLGIALIFCGVYTAQYHQPQATALVFYANDFLHSLLPLEEWSRFGCNAAMMLALSLTSACFPARLRRGERPLAFIAVAIISFLYFTRSLGNLGNDFLISFIVLEIAAYAVYGACKGVRDV